MYDAKNVIEKKFTEDRIKFIEVDDHLLIRNIRIFILSFGHLRSPETPAF